MDAVMGAGANWVVGRVVGMLPGRFLRWLKLDAKVARQITIELGRERPFEFWVEQPLPHLNMSFEVDNRSGFDVMLERLLIEVWVGQPVVWGAILERYAIGRGTVQQYIRFTAPLNQALCEYLRFQGGDAKVFREVDVTYIAYFESRVGLIRTSGKLSRMDVSYR